MSIILLHFIFSRFVLKISRKMIVPSIINMTDSDAPTPCSIVSLNVKTGDVPYSFGIRINRTISRYPRWKPIAAQRLPVLTRISANAI